jgi:predicted ATP-binding protein involved in virulence
MRLKSITVKNLFGIFNHYIPLNTQNRITIIHGPNGFGKSTILRMVEGLLTSRYYEIQIIPFNELRADFENEQYIRITKSEDSPNIVKLFYTSETGEKEFALNLSAESESVPFPLEMMDDLIPEVRRIGTNKWLYPPSGEVFTLSELIECYRDILPLANTADEPEELTRLKHSVNVHLIGTQRLLSHSVRRLKAGFVRNHPYTQTVAQYSSELAEAIESKLAESASLSQSLDRTFPSRLIQHSSIKELSEEEIHNELAALEKKRTELREAGLLDKEKDIDIPLLSQIDPTTKNVLSVYIEDIKKKLSIFDEMASKIKLLQQIVNSRFIYKKMGVSKEQGFIFANLNDKPLSPTQLSSGERHKLVVLYELLFKVKPNSIIFIDEPELSLHVEWQVNALSELEEITQLASLDILMATHSPDIINDRWDLTVELKGLSQ